MCHVLIIEDEVLVAVDIRNVLQAAGATSFAHAETEDDAVDAALKATPAVITSDVNLRAGTGPSAVSRMVDQLGDIPALYITATPEDCAGCPVDMILPKPLNEARLQQLFQEVAPR